MYDVKEIKKGLKIHSIDTKNKFKTNLIAVIITLPLERKHITFNALIPAVLRRGTQNIKSQEEISKKLESMYGAVFDCGVEKSGDNHILKFYLESLNDEFIPQNNKTSIIKESLNLLLDIIFNPLILDKSSFKKDYVDTEKNNLKLLIESKIDNKNTYALDRCIEEMYKGKPYGLYKYGYIEDLDKINSKNLYEYYNKLINMSKIDIFVSGKIDKQEIIDIINENDNIKKLQERSVNNIISNNVNESKSKNKEINIQDKMDVTQGKLVVGLDINLNEDNSRFKVPIYNAILGGSANSKLFQNVREKASLAYTASSAYFKKKNNIFIRCGIKFENYDKALQIIKEQLEYMKAGELQSMCDEQDEEVIYYMSQEASNKFITFDQHLKGLKAVSKKDIEEVANNININTIYFLRN